MNKLEELHLKAIENSGGTLAAYVCAEITRDIAIKFVQFIVDDEPYPYTEDKLTILFEKFLKTV
jgi:hypothetical protein